jgi:hypothetical protein
MSLRRLVLAVSALALAACQQHHHETAAPAADGQSQPAVAAPSEAQRTLEMERTAAEATRRLEEAQQQPLTEAQAEDAYKAFEAERQRVNQQAESQAVEPVAEPAPPPPPQ